MIKNGVVTGMLCLTALGYFVQPLLPSRPRRMEPAGLTDLGLPAFYAQTAWPALHRDARNSDFAPFVAPRVNRIKWTALDGATTLTAPTIGPEGNIYITTGQGHGTRHLHALDRTGRLLWESEPQYDLEDLDSWAVGSSPVVDAAGDLYVSDGNQCWAFHPNGVVKWVAPLPEENSPFLSALLTAQGLVGGVTTQGKIVFFRRESGELAMPILDLPGRAGPPAPFVPPGLWAGGLLDPAILTEAWNIFIGRGVEVATTPVLHPETGRLYVVAHGPVPETGVIYGIDLLDGRMEIAFQTSIGGGDIGSSPAMALDGRQVFLADGQGFMTAIDAQTGEVQWRTFGAASAASPAVGPDGTIYVGGEPGLTALDPEDGTVRWRTSFDAVAASLLPTISPVPPILPTGRPVARTNSVASVSATQVWVVLVVGYEITASPSLSSMILPYRIVLASVDPKDGKLTGQPTVLRDTSEGVITIDATGDLFVSHAALVTSVMFFGLNPILPPAVQFPGPPLAGISALEPVSFRDYALQGIEWVQQLNASVLAALSTGAAAPAITATLRGQVQLQATAETILGAEARREITFATAQEARTRLISARGHLLMARDLLAPPDPGPDAQIQAMLEIGEAQKMLTEAKSLLTATSEVATPPPSVGARPVGGVGEVAYDFRLLWPALALVATGVGWAIGRAWRGYRRK